MQPRWRLSQSEVPPRLLEPPRRHKAAIPPAPAQTHRQQPGLQTGSQSIHVPALLLGARSPPRLAGHLRQAQRPLAGPLLPSPWPRARERGRPPAQESADSPTTGEATPPGTAAALTSHLPLCARMRSPPLVNAAVAALSSAARNRSPPQRCRPSQQGPQPPQPLQRAWNHRLRTCRRRLEGPGRCRAARLTTVNLGRGTRPATRQVTPRAKCSPLPGESSARLSREGRWGLRPRCCPRPSPTMLQWPPARPLSFELSHPASRGPRQAQLPPCAWHTSLQAQLPFPLQQQQLQRRSCWAPRRWAPRRRPGAMAPQAASRQLPASPHCHRRRGHLPCRCHHPHRRGR
mmetsp:Transcript_1279/g.5034  ORF Transcript_1279/g.5034 Transcript_1279/m.5034 type:complete len:346 (+) Transcript_1279:2669-3706(+)